MCRTLIIQKEGGSSRENSRGPAQKLLVEGRTGFSGCQIYAFSPLPHRPNEEELRMKNVDDNTPAVGKQLAGDRSFSLYLPFLPPPFLSIQIKRHLFLRLLQKASEAKLPIG